MNLSMTFREIQCSIVTTAAEGTTFRPDGSKIKTMWWTGMYGKLAHLNIKEFPKTITITDTDNNNEVYVYVVAKETAEKVTYLSAQMPSLPIYLKAA